MVEDLEVDPVQVAVRVPPFELHTDVLSKRWCTAFVPFTESSYQHCTCAYCDLNCVGVGLLGACARV